MRIAKLEEIELLIDQVQKCGGINSAITKLSQSEQQHKKERHDVETRDEALLSVDYQANKNSSNEKMEKEDEEPLIAAIGQDNNHDEYTEAQLEIFVNKIIADRSSSSKTKIEEPK